MARKNLIWLTYDSIRADRTSIGGHSRQTTPTLDAIGSRSDGYAGSCFAHGIWSQASVASIMTGTYPSTHGSGSHNEVLPENIPTVAERLSEAGYRTVGLSSNPYFSPTTGVHRGFDEFDFVSGTELAREAGPTGILSFLRNIRRFSGGFERDKRKHTPDFLLGEIIKDRLQSDGTRDEPLFLAAHSHGVHHPYFPSPAFRSKFASELSMSPDQAAQIAFEQSSDVYARIAEGGPSESDRDVIEAMYDAQVAQIDALIQTIISYIDQLGIGDETILVVTSDHGDLLGEFGLYSHKLVLHDGLMRVPIAVRGSESLASSEFELAQHADIMQTVLAELGVETDGMQGIRLDQDSRELVVAQRGEETYQKTIDEVRSHNPDFHNEHVLPGFVSAARTDDWKFVSNGTDKRLYSLPDEDENVAADHPDVVSEFERRLAEWSEDQDDPVHSSNRAEFDEDVEDLLADLGYLEN